MLTYQPRQGTGTRTHARRVGGQRRSGPRVVAKLALIKQDARYAEKDEIRPTARMQG